MIQIVRKILEVKMRMRRVSFRYTDGGVYMFTVNHTIAMERISRYSAPFPFPLRRLGATEGEPNGFLL